MCAREEERARTRARARARGCDVGYIRLCYLRHILLGGGAPKLGNFWVGVEGWAVNAAVWPVKADFPDFGMGSRGIVP